MPLPFTLKLIPTSELPVAQLVGALVEGPNTRKSMMPPPPPPTAPDNWAERVVGMMGAPALPTLGAAAIVSVGCPWTTVLTQALVAGVSVAGAGEVEVERAVAPGAGACERAGDPRRGKLGVGRPCRGDAVSTGYEG